MHLRPSSQAMLDATTRAAVCSGHQNLPQRVVFGTLARVMHVLAPRGWHINTAFVERINLTLRHHVAAVGRRVMTLCKREASLRDQLHLYHTLFAPASQDVAAEVALSRPSQP